MKLNNRLDIVQSQKLVMTTQLKQSLDILNMSNLELEEQIKKDAQENPVLELERTESIDWGTFIKKNIKNYNIKHYDLDNEITLENIIKYEINLYDYVKSQLVFLKLNKKEIKVCEYIVDCLDIDGYLSCDEKYIIQELNIDEKYFYKCLKYIQQLEPIGIGARDLSECLLIQMENENTKDDILKSIIVEDLNLIGQNKIKLLSKK